jgi:hypothetical protein
VHVIINSTSKEFDAENNPVINPQTLSEELIIEQREKQISLLRQGKKFISQWQNGK